MSVSEVYRQIQVLPLTLSQKTTTLKGNYQGGQRERDRKPNSIFKARQRFIFPLRASMSTRVLFPQLKMNAFQMVVMIKKIWKEPYLLSRLSLSQYKVYY